MTVADALLISLMALGLVVWIGTPLLSHVSSQSGRREDDRTEALLLQKETVYTALRDLEFDFQTGKVDMQDYTALRQQLEGDALGVLRQIDSLDPLAQLDQEIEQYVTAIRSTRRAVGEQSLVSQCAHCSGTLSHDEHFCPSCGRALRA